MLPNYLVCFDLETISARPSDTEICQIAAVAIDPRTLRVVPGSEFESLMKPTDFGKIEDEALAVNRLTREQLQSAPETAEVWAAFVAWTTRWRLRGSSPFGFPLATGFNITNFDLPIVERYCQRYGPTRTERSGEEVGAVFHRVHRYDCLAMMVPWVESDPSWSSLKLDVIRRRMSMPEGKRATHDALRDVEDTAALLSKLLSLHRRLAPRVIWDDCFDPAKVEAELERRRETRQKSEAARKGRRS